jgi:hypothetical protein
MIILQDIKPSSGEPDYIDLFANTTQSNFERIRDTLDKGITIGGVSLANGGIAASGGITGNLTGNVTGNVTGNITGVITATTINGMYIKRETFDIDPVGGTHTLTMPVGFSSKCFHAVIGGLVQNVGSAQGLYIGGGYADSITAVNAIANVVVTCNTTNGTITITNNNTATRNFQGTICVTL